MASSHAAISIKLTSSTLEWFYNLFQMVFLVELTYDFDFQAKGDETLGSQHPEVTVLVLDKKLDRFSLSELN